MWFLVAPVSALRLVILVDLMSNACLYELYLGGTEVLPVDLNIISIIICCYPWYYPTPSFHASIIYPVHIVIHCDLVLVFKCFEVKFSSLVAATSMCPEYFSKYAGIGWRGCPWQGPVEGVGGLLIFFVLLYPLLSERICIRSWFLTRTCCRIDSTTVEIGGAGYLGGGGGLFTIFVWC